MLLLWTIGLEASVFLKGVEGGRELGGGRFDFDEIGGLVWEWLGF